LNIVGQTVEQLGNAAIVAGKKSFKTTKELIEKFIEALTLSINYLICLGHSDAWNYDYETYKTACRHAKTYEQSQVMTFATAISLVFGGKKAVREYLRANKKED